MHNKDRGNTFSHPQHILLSHKNKQQAMFLLLLELKRGKIIVTVDIPA